MCWAVLDFIPATTSGFASVTIITIGGATTGSSLVSRPGSFFVEKNSDTNLPRSPCPARAANELNLRVSPPAAPKQLLKRGRADFRFAAKNVPACPRAQIISRRPRAGPCAAGSYRGRRQHAASLSRHLGPTCQ
jgi:hypothetical protein